jgi:hypothetical protein
MAKLSVTCTGRFCFKHRISHDLITPTLLLS